MAKVITNLVRVNFFRKFLEKVNYKIRVRQKGKKVNRIKREGKTSKKWEAS